MDLSRLSKNEVQIDYYHVAQSCQGLLQHAVMSIGVPCSPEYDMLDENRAGVAVAGVLDTQKTQPIQQVPRMMNLADWSS